MKRKNNFKEENEKIRKMTISGENSLLLIFSFSPSSSSSFSHSLSHSHSHFICLDIFQIYSPPPTQLNRSKSNSRTKINILDNLPSNIPNIDICNEWESKKQYDSTYSSSIMQYKSTIEVIILFLLYF